MMGSVKKKASWHHRMFMWLNSYVKLTIIDVYRIYLHLTVAKRRKVILANMYSFMKSLYQRISCEGILKESGSLTYITLLGFVPFLSFLVLIAPDLPFLNLGEKFRAVVAKNFIPGSANAIMNFVDEIIQRRAGFNVFNFVILIVSSYSLFRVIRNTFDRILSVEIKASADFLTQFVKFIGTIVFGLLIIIVLFSSSSLPLVSKVLHSPLLRWLMLVIPFVLQFLGLMFMYMLLPSVRISRPSLIRGAFWTTVIWVAAKSLFDIYIYNLTNMQAVYGVLAALPIFLMWIYVNWVIVLGGIVLVSVIDSKGKGEVLKKEPAKVVRITLEMFSDSKLNAKLESVMGKKELKKIINVLDEEEN